MKRRSILLPVALLLAPTLIAGALALRLLQREDARLRSEARSAAQDRVNAAADSMALLVRDVQDGLSSSLAELDPAARAEALRTWERDNPLIRHGFLWEQGRGLVQPDPAGPLTAEERGFVSRYEALWDGRVAWSSASARDDAAPPSPRQQVQQLATPRTKNSSFASSAGAAPPEPARTGWTPWFSGEGMNLLGWAAEAGGRTVWGVEIETMALLSRLVAALPEPARAGESFALVDGNGRIVRQTGAREIPAGEAPVAAASLAPAMPHWQVAYHAPPSGSAAAASGFRLVSTLLVAALVLAILAGGLLLAGEARRQERDAMRKTSFVANVSHEMKTPLTTIRMYAELLGEGRVTDEAKRRRYLDTIVREGARLTRLLNNVLDFGRLEQRRRAYRPETLALGEWLGALLEMQRRRVEEAGLRLEVRLPSDGATLTADRDASEQIVLNLLDNAIKYAASGGVVEIEAASAGGRAAIRVLDRGPGVSAALRERVFEKFFRADDSLASGVQGCGLGLSIARRLARDMGGDLVCRARDGGGACFETTLPAGGPAAEGGKR